MKNHISSKKDRKKEHKAEKAHKREKERSDLCCAPVSSACEYAYDSCGNPYIPSSCCC